MFSFTCTDWVKYDVEESILVPSYVPKFTTSVQRVAPEGQRNLKTVPRVTEILASSRIITRRMILRVIIRLEARLQPNIRFTSRHVLAVFTRSAITPPNVNRFGWNLEHSEYIVGGWPWQILGAIHAVATAGQTDEVLFLSSKQCTISSIFRRPNFTKFEHNTSIGVTIKTFVTTEFWKFYRKGRSSKKRKTVSKIFNVLRLQTAITPQCYRSPEIHY